MPRRVRHHTSDEGLAGILHDGGINANRGWMNYECGVHVEIEPFGSTSPFRAGQPCPRNDMGCVADGAYVEFDEPEGLIEYYCGVRNTGFVPVLEGAILALAGLDPEFVKVRRQFWQVWRRKPT